MLEALVLVLHFYCPDYDGLSHKRDSRPVHNSILDGLIYVMYLCCINYPLAHGIESLKYPFACSMKPNNCASE